MNIDRQNDDGSWSPAQPLGYQPRLDWEVYRVKVSGRKGWRGELFDGAIKLETVRARWRWLFNHRQKRAHYKWVEKLGLNGKSDV